MKISFHVTLLTLVTFSHVSSAQIEDRRAAPSIPPVSLPAFSDILAHAQSSPGGACVCSFRIHIVYGMTKSLIILSVLLSPTFWALRLLIHCP